jgi:hypothetical protein
MAYFTSFVRQRWNALRARSLGQEKSNSRVDDLQPGEALLGQQESSRDHWSLISFLFFIMSFASTIMLLLYLLLSLGQSQPTMAASSASLPGTSAYIAPYGFPTSAFSSYYFLPTTPTQEPQPALHDPVLNITYPVNLTNPDTIPDEDPDPVYYPSPTVKLDGPSATAFLDAVVRNVTAVIGAGEYRSVSRVPNQHLTDHDRWVKQLYYLQNCVGRS